MFRNLTLYRFPDSVFAQLTQELFAYALAEQALHDIGTHELTATGFVPPIGRGSEAFTLALDGAALFAHAVTEKILPAAVINDELASRIADIYERDARRVTARERKRIKEEIFSEFMPRAFARTKRVLAYVDMRDGWLVIDTASRAVADGVVSQAREALGRFPVTPVTPTELPRALMTDWLIKSELPDALEWGDECELRDPAEAGAVVRCAQQDLESDEMREHLNSGKQVFRLGVQFNQRLAFVLCDDLVLRKLRYTNIVNDERDSARDSDEDVAAALLTDFTLLRLELRQLFAYLSEQFGVSREAALHLDGGDAHKALRDSCRAQPGATP